jgi:hypothetical protein
MQDLLLPMVDHLLGPESNRAFLAYAETRRPTPLQNLYLAHLKQIVKEFLAATNWSIRHFDLLHVKRHRQADEMHQVWAN